MNTPKVLGISVIVAVAVAFVFALFGSTPAERVVREVVKQVSLGAIPGDEVSGDRFCVGGVCEYHRTGQCADATSTLFSILNPFSATATVDYIRISGLGATSTIGVVVGTSTTIGENLNALLFNSGVWATTTISTSTTYWRVGPGTGFDTGGASGVISDMHAATSSNRAVIGPTDYVIAKATTTNSGVGYFGGLLGANNQFTCDFTVRFVR